MNRRRGPLVLIVLALAVVAAVALSPRLFHRPPPVRDPARLLTANDEVLEVKGIAAIGEAMDRVLKLKLTGLAASLAGYDSAEAFARLVSDQLGFDPRRRDEVAKTGLDPDGRMAFGRPVGSGFVAVLPARDLSGLERTVASLASARLAATELRSESGVLGTRKVFGRQVGPPALATEATDGYLTVFSGSALYERGPGASLGTRPEYPALRAELGDPTLFAFVPPESPTATDLHLSHGGAAALTVSPSAAEIASVATLAQDVAAQLGALSGSGGNDLVGKLDPDAFVALGLGGDPSALKGVWDWIAPANYRTALSAAGVDVPRDILANLQPGAVLSLSVAETANLSQMPELDPRLTNPFRYVYLSGIGRVRDVAVAKRVMDHLVEVAPLFGATMTRRSAHGADVYVTSYQLGEGASVALKDNYVIVTGGRGRMETLLARLDAGAPVAPARLYDGLQVHGLAARADVKRFVDAVRALPASAYGVGGFAIQAAVNRWMDAIAEIDRVDLGAYLENSTLRAKLRFAFATPEKK